MAHLQSASAPAPHGSATTLPLTRSSSTSVTAGRSYAAATLRSNRWFYVGMSVGVLGAIMIGFGPSFYLRPRTMPALAPRVVMHGLLFSSWVVLFLIQA